MSSHRRQLPYLAFVVHRISGLGLAVFLPFHFMTLGLALNGEAALDGFLGWADHPLLKLSETVLVVLLAAHLAGGLRLLTLELVGWTARQNALIALASGFAIATGLAFALNVIG